MSVTERGSIMEPSSTAWPLPLASRHNEDAYGESPWVHQYNFDRNQKRTSPKRSGKLRSEPVPFDVRRVKYPIHHPDTTKLQHDHDEFKLRLENDWEQHYFTTKHSEFRKVMGREDIIAFKYKFYLPGDYLETPSQSKRKSERSIPIAILWDMESGFVRMSPLFKASGFANLSTKSAPRKFLDGHGIGEAQRASPTGGHIDAQGFWIPFEDAKKLCREFCYNIRYALTPMFGNDFPTLCEMPQRKTNRLDYISTPQSTPAGVRANLRSRSDSPDVRDPRWSSRRSSDEENDPRRKGIPPSNSLAKSQTLEQKLPETSQQFFAPGYRIDHLSEHQHDAGDEDADGETVSTISSPPSGYSPRQVYHYLDQGSEQQHHHHKSLEERSGSHVHQQFYHHQYQQLPAVTSVVDEGGRSGRPWNMVFSGVHVPQLPLPDLSRASSGSRAGPRRDTINDVSMPLIYESPGRDMCLPSPEECVVAANLDWCGSATALVGADQLQATSRRCRHDYEMLRKCDTDAALTLLSLKYTR